MFVSAACLLKLRSRRFCLLSLALIYLPAFTQLVLASLHVTLEKDALDVVITNALIVDAKLGIVCHGRTSSVAAGNSGLT